MQSSPSRTSGFCSRHASQLLHVLPITSHEYPLDKASLIWFDAYRKCKFPVEDFWILAYHTMKRELTKQRDSARKAERVPSSLDAHRNSKSTVEDVWIIEQDIHQNRVNTWEYTRWDRSMCRGRGTPSKDTEVLSAICVKICWDMDGVARDEIWILEFDVIGCRQESCFCETRPISHMLSPARLLPFRFDAYRKGTYDAEDFQRASKLIEKSNCNPRRSHGVGCL